MKTLIASALLSVAVLSTVGCSSSPRPNGWCALEVEGTCVMRWKDGVKVPSGEIDMKYEGARCSNGGSVDEKAYRERDMETQANWKKSDFISRATHCGGNTSVKGKEWDI